jgi:hypothetical protein
MPHLKRLSLSGNRNPHGLIQLGSLWCFPRLKELRIGCLSAAISFVEELEEALSCSSLITQDTVPLQTRTLPEALEHIIVQPGPHPITMGGGCLPRYTIIVKDKVMMEKLKALGGGDDGGIKFTLLERSNGVERGRGDNRRAILF